jgi:hypothetical protein
MYFNGHTNEKEISMGRGHFRNILSASALIKKTGAASDIPNAATNTEGAAALEDSPGGSQAKRSCGSDPQPGTFQKKTGAALCVFDDVSVCRYLGIRRRVLNAARKASTRGRDWDCVDDRAGMTKAWIDAYALSNHIVPKFQLGLEQIRPGNGVASVRLIGTHPNPEICSVEKLADGKRMFAHIRNIMQFPIHLNECFDCLDVGGKLEWVGRYNDCQY